METAEGAWGEAICWITSSVGLNLDPIGDRERRGGDEGGRDWTGDGGRAIIWAIASWGSLREGSGCECHAN